MEVEGLKPGCEPLTSPTYPQAVDNPHTWTPAQPGDTPGQVEPDDSRPKPIDAADPLDEAIEAAARAMYNDMCGHGIDEWPGALYEQRMRYLIRGKLAVRAAAPIIAAPIQRVVADLSQDLSELFADRTALRAERDTFGGLYEAERTRASEFADEASAWRQKSRIYRRRLTVAEAALATAVAEVDELATELAEERTLHQQTLARLATAERDALTRAADALSLSGADQDTARWLRKRAKEAGA